MAGADGRSIFGFVYIGFSLVSLWILNQVMYHDASTGYAGAGIAGLCILCAVIFGIMGTYKLMTREKGNSSDEDYDFSVQGNETSHKFLIPQHNGNSNFDLGEYTGEKRRKNSNIEVQIWKNKPLLMIIILLCLFLISLF